jgi:hypothetical protein
MLSACSKPGSNKRAQQKDHNESEVAQYNAQTRHRRVLKEGQPVTLPSVFPSIITTHFVRSEIGLLW